MADFDLSEGVVKDLKQTAPAPAREYTLEELVAEITEDNRHGEVDFGPAVGNENQEKEPCLMQQAHVRQEQIEINSDGMAIVAGTNTKVIEIVVDHTVQGRSAQEIHLQHPHLSLSQIQAALEFYRTHEQEIDREVERRYELAEELRKQATHQFTRHELEERLKATQRKSA